MRAIRAVAFCVRREFRRDEGALAHQASRLETYVMAADPPAAEAIEQNRQRLASTSTEEICRSEVATGYGRFAAEGDAPARVRSMTDQVLSEANRDGCL